MTFAPNVSKEFLADFGKTRWYEFLRRHGQKKAAKRLHEWRLEHEEGYRELVAMMRDRGTKAKQFDGVIKARGFRDPEHYRNAPHYCKCPGGGVEDHNREYEAILNGG